MVLHIEICPDRYLLVSYGPIVRQDLSYVFEVSLSIYERGVIIYRCQYATYERMEVHG